MELITYNLQGYHGEFEPGKVQYSTPKERIEAQNLGKDQTLAALAAMAALIWLLIGNLSQPETLNLTTKPLQSIQISIFRQCPFCSST